MSEGNPIAELAALLNNTEMKNKGGSSGMTRKEQLAYLREFMKAPSFRAGDIIQRNKFGKKRYKWPREGEVAVVQEVFPVPMLDHDSTDYGVIAAIVSEGAVMTFTVDFRCYELAKD